MNTSRKNILIICVCIGALYFISNQSISPINVEHEQTIPNSPAAKATRNIAAIPKTKAVPAVEITATTAITSSNENPVLEDILSRAEGQYAYRVTLQAFDQFTEKEALASWVAMGVAMRSDAAYSAEYRKHMEKLNQNPQATLDAITANFQSISTKDAFVRGELISMVHLLKIDQNKKIAFFGERFSDEVTFDQNNDWDANSANITNAMIYMSQYQPDEQTLTAHIQNAVLSHRNDKQALKEIIPRLLHQFPQMSKVIEVAIKQ